MSNPSHEESRGVKKKRQKDQPVSLSPLDPKEALADLMKVKPQVKKALRKKRNQ